VKCSKPTWAVGQRIRGDRLDRCVEDVCKHGVGHPNQAWVKTQTSKYAGIHGCDGCCAQPSAFIIKEEL